MKTPTFFLDAADGLGARSMGQTTPRSAAVMNLLAEIQVALDRLEEDGDGSQITLTLSRRDMTKETTT